MRYGLANNLTFLLPQNKFNAVGWPNAFEPNEDMRRLAREPDLLCYHSVYSQRLADVMPRDTFYLTIVRDPFAQIRSTYVYYDLKKLCKKNLSEVLTEAPRQREVCGAQVYNPVSFDLGLPEAAMANLSAIADHITFLDNRFNLVMIVEYMDESLIIMRDRLGWTNMDILSFILNSGSNTRTTGKRKARMQFISNSTLHINLLRQEKAKVGSPQGLDLTDSDKDKEFVYRSMLADTMLYLHFKRKLEAIIKKNKLYLAEEKKELQRLRTQWMKFCIKDSVPARSIADLRFQTYGNSSQGYVLTKEGLQNQTCIELAMAELPFVQLLDKHQPAATEKEAWLPN